MKRRRASELVVLLRAVGWLPTVVLLIAAQGGAGVPAITPSAVQLVSTSQTRDAPSVFEGLPPSAETTEGAATNLQMLIRAVVHIQTSDSAGSGAVVAEGKILTAAHVVGDAAEVTVWFSNGARRTGLVTARDKQLDVAVIDVARVPRSVQPLDWESAVERAVGTRIWAWGYPQESAIVEAGFSRAPTASQGIVSARRTRGGVAYLQIDAAVSQGSSGGPIVDTEGRIVGLAVFVLAPAGRDPEGLNFAVDLVSHRAQIHDLLDVNTEAATRTD